MNCIEQRCDIASYSKKRVLNRKFRHSLVQSLELNRIHGGARTKKIEEP
jgi:hypothetical protein